MKKLLVKIIIVRFCTRKYFYYENKANYSSCLFCRLIATALPGDNLIGRLANDIVVHLNNTVTYPGPLTEFLTMLRPGFGAGEGPAHLILQLHWTRLAVLYRLACSAG